MRIFAISDLHLSNAENIDKPMDMFGDGWENHAERLRSAWTDMIRDDDIVLLPGDISWGLKLEEAIADFVKGILSVEDAAEILYQELVYTLKG